MTEIYVPEHLDKKKIEKIFNLAVDGLLVDGEHHKQWYFEQILSSLGVSKKKLRSWLNDQDYDWEDGVAP